MVKEGLISIKEVSELVGLSVPTLYRHLNNGPPNKRSDDVFDINKVPSVRSGGKRFWNKEALLFQLSQKEKI